VASSSSRICRGGKGWPAGTQPLVSKNSMQQHSHVPQDQQSCRVKCAHDTAQYGSAANKNKQAGSLAPLSRSKWVANPPLGLSEWRGRWRCVASVLLTSALLSRQHVSRSCSRSGDTKRLEANLGSRSQAQHATVQGF
jgi:hypothetical protein